MQTMERTRATARRRLAGRLAVALAAVSVAIPAGAEARPIDGPVEFDLAPGATRSAPPSTRTVEVGGGFDWGDAAIGAGTMLTLVALAGVGAAAQRGRQFAPPTPGRS